MSGTDLTASALVAAVGDFCTFKSARQFASWVGLVPRHVGTGGKPQQLGISKRGDTYLRTLLIAGARAVIARSGKSGWIERLLQRRHYNVVVVALANKMARTALAVLRLPAGAVHLLVHLGGLALQTGDDEACIGAELAVFYPRSGMRGKVTLTHDAIRQALKVDAHRPRQE